MCACALLLGQVFIAMAKALAFIDPDQLSMTVVLTALNRFLQVRGTHTHPSPGLPLHVGEGLMGPPSGLLPTHVSQAVSGTCQFLVGLSSAPGLRRLPQPRR